MTGTLEAKADEGLIKEGCLSVGTVGVIAAAAAGDGLSSRSSTVSLLSSACTAIPRSKYCFSFLNYTCFSECVHVHIHVEVRGPCRNWFSLHNVGPKDPI